MKESDLMHEAVIVDVVRTPAGRRNGKLKDWHPTDLGAHVLKALQERNDLDPSIVDDVVTGCVSQVGEQAFNIGRSAVLAAGWPSPSPPPRSTASAVRASRRFTSLPRASWPVPTTSSSPSVSSR